MEGTHTALHLYKPIHEMCFISLYFPTRKSRGFTRAGHSPREVQPLCHPARTKQRQHYYKSADEVLQSCEATKGAVAQLHWLAVERHQLLTDLLSLCSDCAERIKMGNQDGKLQLEGHGVGSSSITLPRSPEHKRAASRVRKLKKLKKMDSAEEFLQSKMKKKVQSGASDAPGTPVSIHGPDTPGSGSYVSVSSQPLLPMDEDFQIAHDGWDFMEEPRSFECEMDCTEFGELCLEYENERGEQLGRTKAEETASRSCLDVDRIYQNSSDQEKINRFTQAHKKTPSSPIDAHSNLRSWTRSPTSSSLSGVFNVSYPPNNSLQSMSPLSSQLPSPQMNHRIVLLPDEEDDGNKRSSKDEPKVTAEVIDKNGNRRTATRLDLNLSHRFNLNGAGSSSAATSENSLLRPEDIWMLDGYDSITQEPLCRPSRPDHLDFLRITPPEDDIIGDTPCYPKLGIAQQKQPDLWRPHS